MPKDTAELRPFTIDLARWHRGKGHLNSSLLRCDGTMCCLGFFAIEVMGATPGDILEKAFPSEVPVFGLLAEQYGLVTGPLTDEAKSSTYAEHVIGNINDDELITDELRQALLRAAFGELGYLPVFVGGEGGAP